MLTIQQKLKIFDSFNVLKKKIRKDHIRIDYAYTNTRKQQKNVICQFNINTGNGYVCGRYLKDNHEYNLDSRGWINIKMFSESELDYVIEKSIQSLS